MTIYFGMLPPLTFGSRGGSNPLKNPLIDFTAATLDPRVSYTGPEHTYIGSDGKVMQSTANVWPLEYSDGVVAGRHEPEAAATNYLPSTTFDSISAVGGSGDWIYGGAAPTVQDSSLGIKAALSGTGSVLTGIYSEGTGNFIASAQDSGAPSSWMLIKRTFNNSRNAVLRWYTARQDASVYMYGKTVAAPVGDMVASVMRMVDANAVYSALPQVEMGSIVTSPIINAAGASASRSAASAVINEPAATGAIIRYTDGSQREVTATDGKIIIPAASLDWRSRFIKQVELVRK